MIVLDTHVWIWWLSNPEQLSKTARGMVDEAAGENSVFISSISAWEVAMLAARDRLRLTMSVGDWIAASETLPFIHFVAVSNSIAVKSVQLPGYLHHDPADRIIMATALSMGAVLITKDEKIRNYSHVKSAWQDYDKGISIPPRLFKGSDSRSAYSFGFPPWTRDVAQDIEHFTSLFDYMGRNTKVYLEQDSRSKGKGFAF